MALTASVVDRRFHPHHAGGSGRLRDGARSTPLFLFGMAVAVFYRATRQDVYNILWAVVFGFATLNILSLAARRLEPTKRGLTFGELMAVMVVLLSIFLLGWEMLNLFHVFPIKLRR